MVIGLCQTVNMGTKRINKTILVCDSEGCTKTSTIEEGEMYFGGHPSSGWVNVTIRHHTSVVPNPFPNEDYLFCSKQCCIDQFVRILDGQNKSPRSNSSTR